MGLVNRKRVWWFESWVSGILGAFIAEKLIRVFYRVVRKRSPDEVFDADNVGFSWPMFLVWAVAGGIGLGTAKVASNRVAVVGWKLATGTAPPKDDDDQPPT